MRSSKLQAQSVAELNYAPTSDLTPDPSNPRKHSREQIRAIARSIQSFGFNAPILIDRDKRIIAGHGRFEAAKHLGLSKVPVICLDHLSKAQIKAYMLADNKLTDRSSWDDAALAECLNELSELALEFDIEATGFELPEIDFRIQSLSDTEQADRGDEFDLRWPRHLGAGRSLDSRTTSSLLRKCVGFQILRDSVRKRDGRSSLY